MRHHRIGAALGVILAGGVAASIALAEPSACSIDLDQIAADNETLPTLRGKFTALTDDQRQRILEVVKGRYPPVHPNADLPIRDNDVIPSSTVLNELPDELRLEIPYIRNFKYVLDDNRILLIDPANRAIATVIDELTGDGIKK